MHIVEALLSKIDATENVHSPLSAASCVPISPFYLAQNLPGLEPDTGDEVEH